MLLMAFVQLWGLLVVKMSAHSDVVSWNYCPKAVKINAIGSWNKKQLFLLDKVENGKYSEVETSHLENIDGRYYYRLCENFWWPLGTAIFGQCRPNLGPQFFFFSFTRTLLFFWDLGLTLFHIPKDVVFAEILVFCNIFGFPAVNWAPKWTKTLKFQCVPF